MKRQNIAAFALLLAMGFNIARPANDVHGQTSGSGTVTVTGTNNAVITITITDTTAAYGTSLQPDGSGTGGEISSVTGSSGNQGAYYIWTPSSVPNVSVKSNAAWSGTVDASANGGTSTSMSIASGVLRWCTAVPGGYAAAAACTSFATTAQSWVASGALGTNTYTHYYGLRVDWNDTIGTFSSTVTYSVTQ
ncbi:MAG: hypothetical protein ACKVVP_18620 [Chloroflexota bacterium]